MHECFSIRDGHLYIEDCNTSVLAEKYGTPLNVISEAQLRGNFRKWKTSLENSWTEGPVNVLPSVKSNLTMATRHILSQEGAGCDTFGESELYVALECGVKPELISMNGTAKTRTLIHKAIEVGARITIDNPMELDVIQEEASRLGKVAKVRFRLRLHHPDLSQPTDFMEDEVPIAELLRIYKPGIPYEHALPLGKRAIQMPNVELRGVHFHIARNSHSLHYWKNAIENLIRIIADFNKAWDGWLPKEIDLGGGFAQQNDPSARGVERVAQEVAIDDIPSPESYCQLIANTVRAEMQKHKLPAEGVILEIEPGRAVYGSSAIHLTSVKGWKTETDPTPWKWVEVDTTAMFLSSIVYEHSVHSHLICNKADKSLVDVADIVGISCGFDRILSQVHLPKLEIGDVVSFFNTGAYEDAWSPNFNGLPRPATILVNGDQSELIKRRETISDVFGRDNVPARLLGNK